MESDPDCASAALANAKGVDFSVLINELLKKDIELIGDPGINWNLSPINVRYQLEIVSAFRLKRCPPWPEIRSCKSQGLMTVTPAAA